MSKVLACVLICGCAVSDPTGSVDQEAGTTTYVNLVDLAGIDQGSWYGVGDKLRSELAAEHPEVTALTFSCSVSSKIGFVHDCAWTLAGSRAAVDGGTAAIAIDASSYECHVHPKTTAGKLVALLANASDALHVALPGTTSIADGLPECLAHPVGGTPLPAPSTATTYVEASGYYATAAYQQKWRDAQAALVAGFDQVCGDTFCGGDFGDLRSLQIACAVTKSTGNVKGCSWVFGGSYALVAKTGALTETSRTWQCPISMHGTLPQLIATVTAAGTTDVLHRALPGVTTTAYDALLACLP
jgi:hypothetical protein